MKLLLTALLLPIIVGLLILSCPAVTARQACIALAGTHGTQFEWHAGDTSCWYDIEGQLIPTEGL